jgi:hypothetical protein
MAIITEVTKYLDQITTDSEFLYAVTYLLTEKQLSRIYDEHKDSNFESMMESLKTTLITTIMTLPKEEEMKKINWLKSYVSYLPAEAAK